jgi:hypothetical protein
MTDPDRPFHPPGEAPKAPPPPSPYPPANYPDYPSSGYPPPPPYPPGQPYPGYQPPYPGPPVGYPGGHSGYNPYQVAKPPGTNGMAIASLICSVGGLFCGVTAIVGVILGFIAMQQTKQSGQNGYGLALAGVITGGALLALWLVWVFIMFIVAAASP